MVRLNLMDKQHLLETTVQKYRSELAAATSTIAGKDILIGRLQRAAMEHEEELVNRDKRIRQLESKLALALNETRNLSEQLTSNSTRDLHHPSRSDTSSSEYQSSFVPRRSSQELAPDGGHRVSFRNAMYRRPSNNAGSESAEDFNGGIKSVLSSSGDGGGGHDLDMTNRNGSRISRKRNSVSDNAISRLTLSTPRTDDKFGRGSSACVVQ
ncbi:uncharacterized protein LOC101857233 [Aplysia californica]|uniref:Uncharacterized protein LOC101857233 n=1 Tax=Aplysia californica TaxID=6500 RepID=A0ABM0JGF0_APLCA|nr:uncharacterized protein LOC101857233 [Aplysia californica]